MFPRCVLRIRVSRSKAKNTGTAPSHSGSRLLMNASMSSTFRIGLQRGSPSRCANKALTCCALFRVGLSSETGRKSTPLRCKSFAARARKDNSVRQGAHQVAQKCKITGRPLWRRISRPSSATVMTRASSAADCAPRSISAVPAVRPRTRIGTVFHNIAAKSIKGEFMGRGKRAKP